MSTATQSWRPQLERAQTLWLATPLPGFLRWWVGQLRTLLPVAWRGWLGSGAQWHALQPMGAGWMLRRLGHAEPLFRWEGAADRANQLADLKFILNTVDRADLRVVLLVPGALVLRRTLALPLAARRNLREVLGFEMDRQTPFHVAQVYYAAHDVPTPAPPGLFHAGMVVVPRDALDPLLGRAAAHGLLVDAVDVAAGTGRLGVNLLPRSRVPHHANPRRRLNLALGAACVLLLALALGQGLHNRRTALAQMQATVDAMQGEARQVAALRQQLQDNAGAADFLARRKRQTVTKLSVLADATARLPEGAWLERFSVDNSGQIGLQGQSQQATRLLDVLKDSALIAEPSFQGSIQPDPATGKERFYMVAHVREAAASTAGTPARDAPGHGDMP